MNLDEIEALHKAESKALAELTRHARPSPTDVLDAWIAAAGKLNTAMRNAAPELIAAARERDKLCDALAWALAEISGENDYRSGRQQIDAMAKACALLEVARP